MTARLIAAFDPRYLTLATCTLNTFRVNIFTYMNHCIHTTVSKICCSSRGCHLGPTHYQIKLVGACFPLTLCELIQKVHLDDLDLYVITFTVLVTLVLL